MYDDSRAVAAGRRGGGEASQRGARKVWAVAGGTFSILSVGTAAA